MASLWIDERDIKFQLHEVFNIGETLLGKGRYADHDVEMCNMVLTRRRNSPKLRSRPPIRTRFIASPSKRSSRTARFSRRKPITASTSFIVKAAG